MSCNLMCKMCWNPLDPSDNVITCKSCGSKYFPCKTTNYDLKPLDSNREIETPGAVRLAEVLHVSKSELIEGFIDFLVEEQSLSRSEANRVVIEKIIKYK